MERNRKNVTADGQQSPWICALIGAGIGIGITLVAMLLMPILLLGTSSPNELVILAAPFCVAIGGCVASFVGTRLSPEQSLMPSLLCLGMMALPLVVASMFVTGERDIVMSAVILLALAASTMFTSFFMLKTASSKKKRVKKLMKRR